MPTCYFINGVMSGRVKNANSPGTSSFQFFFHGIVGHQSIPQTYSESADGYIVDHFSKADLTNFTKTTSLLSFRKEGTHDTRFKMDYLFPRHHQNKIGETIYVGTWEIIGPQGTIDTGKASCTLTEISEEILTTEVSDLGEKSPLQ